ncbi:LysR family transcriptional regulator (plasmid) [Azospirillum baldaniorum]|uniref:Transcriptional Regulator, LysR family n=1 Tax=Azospirillum baldaniorum TaxID=1064539 RepID=A0A9P1K1D4_9PROT|nr:transcriptional regulator GcvA [Azospirillum baldaniorum]AWJ94615.1 LysR family transcriptional regulator [Azospirillum baldaniorum]TWA64111.1 DNA-binding transcriptional LysR family regulator [Azospirillum baldaniorum]TWA73305.1 DNA-binding transcriptional LysR family regulator [Azospirillum brasilense]CCD03768.1 transcriptional Regulator, LysR family [Azospirillum baldaniorum]
MGLQRRLLPSMSALSAFEAAARTGSFTAAAQELALTQGAVSRQIKALEDQLGVPLFVRRDQRVALTPAGESYAAEVREALHRVGAATLRVMTAPQGGVLKLAVLPTFGTRWLVPRLPAFQAAHPQVIIHFMTKMEPFDFRSEDLDAAIHFGAADWPGAVCERLMEEEVLPLCAPSFLEAHPIRTAPDLVALPLLHTTSRPEAWRDWFAAQGIERHEGAGMFFEQFSTTAQAAITGLGVALLPTLLVQAEMRDGALVPALDRPYRNPDRAYHLVHPSSRAHHPPLMAFREWLLGACASASAGRGR